MIDPVDEPVSIMKAAPDLFSTDEKKILKMSVL